MIDGEQVFKRPHLNVGDSSVENHTYPNDTRFRESTVKAFRFAATFLSSWKVPTSINLTVELSR